MLKNVRIHTVRLPMCSTVAPMARAGGGDITGNVLGQSFTSPSPCTHVQGAYGAPTGAVGGAANGRRREFWDGTTPYLRDIYALLSNPGIHHNPLSAGIAWERVVMAR